MADYIPATIVRVLKNVPLDSTYTDTIYFESIGAQSSYFIGKTKYAYTDNTYQRVNSSVAPPRGPLSLRVPEIADNLYDCNYVMFQNSNYGNKWFYGFIRQVNYVNPNNTEIIYELDHYQTWCFDINVMPSLIEREHPENDDLYSNLVPEPFNEMDMYSQNAIDINLSEGTNTYYICIGVNADPDGNLVSGDMYEGVYTGVKLYSFTSASEANSFIQSYADTAKLEAIVTIFMSPYDITGVPGKQTTVDRPTTINGYTPKNNKLFTYPFCKLQLSNRQGSTIDFYYEYFSQFNDTNVSPLSIIFESFGYGGLRPKAYCLPLNYNGANAVGTMRVYDKSLSTGDFPRCAWTGNAFANYLSGEALAETYRITSNGINSSIIDVLSIGANIGVGAAAGGGSVSTDAAAAGAGSGISSILGNFKSALNSATNLQTEMMLRSKCPGITKGIATSSNLIYSTQRTGFTIKQYAISPKMAKIVDDYFDMYGYACGELKTPNFTSRESWNYVKTNNVIITGSVPVQSMDAIKSMFNSGIRFWHGDFVGDYTRSNNIRG